MGAGWAVCERRLYGSASASEPYLERPGVRPLENTALQIAPTDGYARTDNRKPHVAFVFTSDPACPRKIGFALPKVVSRPSAQQCCSIGAGHENWPRHAVGADPDIFPARLPARTHANPAIRGPPQDAKTSPNQSHCAAKISTFFQEYQ